MSLKNSSHQDELREAGWRTRGYLPHFDGRAIPQFITLHLGDSVPTKVIERWQRQLIHLDDDEGQIVLQRRIESIWIKATVNAISEITESPTWSRSLF